MLSTRQEVYAALDTERAYQDRVWREDTTLSGGRHTPAEWLVYLQSYLTQAMNEAARFADPESTRLVMNTVRKLTAMGVVCMEQNGAIPRTTDTLPINRQQIKQ